MSKKKKKVFNHLSQDERENIACDEQYLKRTLKSLEDSKRFNLGDYLIRFEKQYDENGNEGVFKPDLNCYGAPIKYKVIFITESGVAYIKTIDTKGEPTGYLISCVNISEDIYESEYRFELDPDYADSLILGSEYDPAILHKTKKYIWKEVTKHNKDSKVNTQFLGNVVSFFKETKVGDTLWSSINGSYFIQDKRDVSKAELSKTLSKADKHTYLKGPFITVLTVRDKNGNVKDITADFFHRKALYKARPRTYRELNI